MEEIHVRSWQTLDSFFFFVVRSLCRGSTASVRPYRTPNVNVGHSGPSPVRIISLVRCAFPRGRCLIHSTKQIHWQLLRLADISVTSHLGGFWPLIPSVSPVPSAKKLQDRVQPVQRSHDPRRHKSAAPLHSFPVFPSSGGTGLGWVAASRTRALNRVMQ